MRLRKNLLRQRMNTVFTKQGGKRHVSISKRLLWGAATSAAIGRSGIKRRQVLQLGTSGLKWSQNFYDQVGPENTSNTMSFIKKMANMKAMNLNSFRTSIAWSRLLPDGKTLNPKAVAFIEITSRVGGQWVEPIINLFHLICLGG